MTMTEQMSADSPVSARDMITITARLAQLMAEEVDLLDTMKISKIEALQREKLFLIGALEAQKKRIDKHPGFSDTIPSQDKKDLQEVVDVFNDILEENHRKLMLAKEINYKIVQAITHVVKEHTLSRAYDNQGIKDIAPFETLSVTLDKRI